MTIKTSVHSNAFNFMSFMQGGVDPRTGQYTVSLSLPDVKTNDLQGPGLPLSLGFNPLNTIDSGYGRGWNLQLSQYDVSKNIISLSTGETFALTSQDPEVGGRARMWFGEQKLDTFHCYAVPAVGGGKHYWVMHKSGLKEVLAPQAGGVALPIEIHAPSGHKVTLSYNTFATNESILNEVKDGEGNTVLKVQRVTSSNQVHIDLGAGGANTVRFTLNLIPTTALVRQIVLPTPDNACWWFDYGAEKNGYAIIREARTPVGGRETILYEDNGHSFPDGGGVKPRNPPRVTTHITDTGDGLAQIKVGYSYANAGSITQSNFLGAGVTVPYTGDGVDNLYKYNGEYHYETLETLYESVTPGAAVVRTVRRRFNKFHLLTDEVTSQGKNIRKVITDYHLDPVQFPEQPKNFQLPESVSTTWDIDETGQSRTETVRYEHDLAGNLTKQTQPTGIVETSTWYDAACGADCPTDPEGFTRYLKEKRVTPGPSENPGAPVLVTAYTYKKLPPVDDSPMNDWWVPDSETLMEGSQVLQKTQYTPFDTPGDAFKHGRMAEMVVTMNGKDTKTTYSYAKIGTVLETTETLTGFDHEDPAATAEERRHVQKTITLEHSLLNGEPLLNHDDNDVEIRYTYDVLRRVTSETVAPADEDTDPDENYEATRSYTYTLCDASVPAAQRTQARQSMEDVNGVHTVTHFDGLNRAIEEWRDNADAEAGNSTKALRQTYTAHYDVSGNLVDETEFDWLGAEPLALKSTYEYDDWGAQKCVTGPDRVKVYDETIPVGTVEHPDGPVQRSWSQQGTKKTGVTETWLNLFEKPVRIQRFNLNDERISRHDYEYDGLGRTAKEITGIEGVRRTTSFVYDAFDRLLVNTLPLGAQVTRTFAPHSSEDLPTKISVDTRVLGEQTFDGLGRMIQSITGGRTKTFSYAPGFSQPASVLTPSGRVIEYTYIPQLGEEPVSRRLVGEEGGSAFAIDNLAFGYDPKNARLLTCKVDDVEMLKREYFSTGEVSQENGIVAGEPYQMKYLYSRLGRLRSYTDVLLQEQRYEYDFAGRLSNTRLGSTTSAFTFDELGRPYTVLTSDSVSGQSLTVTLGYDEFGRETERKFEFGTTTQTLTQKYDDVDCLTERTLVQGEGPAPEVLRLETYTYDLRGRLSSYTCEGTERPVDSAGTVISSQEFNFDGLDNITTLRTNEGLASDNFAIYLYGQGTQDPAQLQSILNISENPAYPDRSFTYDADGNLTTDEEERTLTYDALGRLTAVLDGANAAHYQYDPLDKLSVHSAGGSQDKLFYRDGVLANQVGAAQSSTFLRGGDHLLAEQRSEGISPQVAGDMK
jgi:YD repeat-containing protein